MPFPTPAAIAIALLLLQFGCDTGTGDYDEANEVGALALRGDLYDEEFESSSWSSVWSGSWKPAQVNTGYTGKGLRTRIAQGSHYGSNLSHFVNQDDEMYFRYYLKFGANWSPAITGKLPGPADLHQTDRCKGGKKPTNAECWSARMMWRPATSTQTNIGYYLYHVEQAGIYGDTFGSTSDPKQVKFEAPGYTPLAREKWYCIEGQVKLNSPGESNGLLRGWVNGRPAQERTGIRFRDSAAINVERMWLDIYYGGKDTSNKTQDVYLDRMALSTKRVGCDSKPNDPMWEPGAEAEVFKDMPPGSLGYAEAKILKSNGITVGCRSGENPMFCPRMKLPRSQMATFFQRAMKLPAASQDYFDDDEGSIYEDNHNRLFEAGITKGCGDRAFCGNDEVTRGQMAAFISRALSLPPASQDYFNDDNGTTFEAAINKLMEAGISNGCGGDSFCANDGITRAQTAIFLVRAFDL